MSTILNILVRGQSNAIFLMEGNGWAGAAKLGAEVERLLGFDGASQKIHFVYDRYEGDGAATAFGGTALIGDWLSARNGDWHQGWQAGRLETMVVNQVNQLSPAEKAAPAAVLWLHSENDSKRSDLTADEWMNAVRYDAGLVRQAWGKSAAGLPYLFVDAHPYWGTDNGHQAIRQGMERLAKDASFNADIASRALDLDLDRDDYDGNGATREYGGSHISDSDAVLLAGRIAKVIAEQFAVYAQPGSPVALAGGNLDDHGPQVVGAELVGASQLRLTVAHDGSASGFQSLDPDAAGGIGWSVRDGSKVVEATKVQVVDGSHLLVTFSGSVPSAGKLFYGYGYGRLGGADGTGQGNAVYDNQGMPIWVSADGLKVGTAATDLPAPTPAPAPAPTQTEAPVVDWYTISKTVLEFYETNGWWASWEEIQAMQAAQPTPSPVVPPPSKAASIAIGSGSDTLVLKISQDAYLDNAQYTVSVDGRQIGGTLSASAIHGSGITDSVTVKGDWGTGDHKVTVRFLNDAYGGSADKDRNLHIDGIDFNGKAVAGGTANLQWEGPADFGFAKATAAPAPASVTVGSGSDSPVLKVSQDAWQGDAQYVVRVDGKQIGGTLSAKALHNSGLSDTVTVKGDWAAGPHKVEVQFLNDAYGGSAATDRNLFVDGASYNGEAVSGATLSLMSNGAQSFSFTEAAQPSSAPAWLSAGTGPDSLVLRLSQDAWQGSAQYTVKVDGKQIGGTFTAGAAHGSGQADTLTLHGDWAPGSHKVEVNFLNDAYGGSAATDRNLFVDSASYNGKEVSGAALSLMSSGAQSFAFTEAGPTSEFAGKATWSEEFNSGYLDRTHFPVLYGGGSTYWNGAFQWDDREVSVSGGSLHIALDKQANGVWKTGGVSTSPNQWNSGLEFTYGKVEIMAKVSQEVAGAGPCFLLWPTNGDWPPEIDILETPKGDGMFNLHWAGPNGEDYYEPTLFNVDLTQWHVYGLEWTPDRLTMTLDGQVMATRTDHIPHQDMAIGLQGHVGAAWDEWYGGSPNSSGVSHIDIAVDYVRYYDFLG